MRPCGRRRTRLNMGWPRATTVLNLDHAPGFADGCQSGAGYPDINPARPDRAVRRVRQNIARRVRRRAGLGAARHGRSAPLDDGGRVQRNLRALPFLARPQRRQPVGGVRVAFSRGSRQHRGLCRVDRSAHGYRNDPGCALCAFRRNRRPAAHFGRSVLRGGRPADFGRFPDDDAVGQKTRFDRACRHGRGVYRYRPATAAVTGGAAVGNPAQYRRHLCHPPAGYGMNSDANPILTLVWTFGLMSLFAVGGANAAIPEMHRVAVDVQHWMTDKQFADVFAISQMSPGPNVLIVTLIGYTVAGVGGALVATLAMCVPTAVLAYYVSRLFTRSSQSRWPAIIQAALVPLSIGLMSASGLILALTSDRTWIAALVTAVSAVLAFATRLNPLWLLLAGGCLGFAGVI